MSETKVCTRCGERKPLDSYYFVSKKLGSRRGQCKPCMADIKAMQKDPNWKPSCSRCGVEMDRMGPGRRLCKPCFSDTYDLEAKRPGLTSHYLRIKPCSACGVERLREDHLKGTSLCAVCRSVPQSRRKSLRLYNLTPREYVEMLESQHYHCAICGVKTRGHWNVDHKHSEPMIVRGILCGPCNTMIALGRDNPDRLRAAAGYLEDPPAQHLFPGRVTTLEANRKDGWAGKRLPWVKK